MNLLLSYPRSGNTWVRYCVEYLTKQPTIGYTVALSAAWDMKCLGSFVDLGVDLDADNILFKRHALHYLHEDVDKLVLIIRNYKECIIKHKSTNPAKKRKPLNIHFLENANYMGLIEYYDQFVGDKVLIYYEELITNIEPILEQLLTLLEYDDSYLKSFMENLDQHKVQSLNLYGNSSTQGKKILHHSYELSEELTQQWDEYLLEHHKLLFNKYLQRYVE